MILNEKNLIRQMKAAAKGAGYKFFVEETSQKETTIWIWTEAWAVKAALPDLPRTVLALLVEHTGKLPQAWDRLCVTESETQRILEDEAEAEAKMQTEFIAGNPLGAGARLVPVLLRGRQGFQDPGGTFYTVSPAALGLVEREAATKTAADVLPGRLRWEGGEETVTVPYYRPSADVPEEEARIWAALESVDLGAAE